MEPANARSGAVAYERIHRAIGHLELLPGAPLSEGQLVGAYGFSEAAVRSALARLRAEGLVIAEARRCHVVAR